MTERVDCAVIGAGVVGLAVARALAQAGRETVLLEAADRIGTGTSSRNSEVIHAGLYYPTGSLKARFCVQGRRALYAYCHDRGIEAPAVGKLVVATTEAQVPALRALKEKADANGVEEVDWLTAREANDLEPEVRCVAALWSRTSGIVDSHAYMLALRGDFEDAGGAIAFLSPVVGGEIGAGGIRLRVGGAEPTELLCRHVVNAAGLAAIETARRLAGMPAARVPHPHFAKGNYFMLSGGRPPFKRLIYPMPTEASLGLHATVDRAGQVRFGPDVEWVPAPDYLVDPKRADVFYAAIRDYWPGLPDDSLVPAYAGVRPKLVGPGEAAADFLIQGPAEHGVDGLINLFGIESPGLTSSLAIADHVAGLLARG